MRCEETIAFEAYDVAVGAGESCCSFFSLFCVVCLGKKCPKTLILFMSSSVDPPSWWCIPKTSQIITNVFNNTH